MFIEKAILLAYAVTIVSETAIIIAIQKPNKLWQWILGIVLINSLTHPIAIYFLHIQNAPYIFVELGVFILEGIWYNLAFQVGWKKSFAISTIANIFSILVGIGIRFLFRL